MKNLLISLFLIILISKSHQNTLSKFIEKKSKIPNLKISSPLNEEIKENEIEKDIGMQPPEDIDDDVAITREESEEDIEEDMVNFCSKGKIIRGKCICRKGMKLINGDCKYIKKRECPSGFVKQQGRCRKKNIKPNCPKGYILRGRQCVIEIKKIDTICPLGFTFKKGNCVPVDEEEEEEEEEELDVPNPDDRYHDDFQDPPYPGGGYDDTNDDKIACPFGYVFIKGKCKKY